MAADTVNVRVVLADDQVLVRAGFRVILESEPGISVVGEAADGAAAVDAVLTHRPDVVCLDVQMPGVVRTRTAGGCSSAAIRRPSSS
jgi:DNA-binding NarL/FixJ family response regulator